MRFNAKVEGEALISYLNAHPDVLDGQPWKKDLAVSCACGAKAGERCRTMPMGMRRKVHFARRLKRLMLGLR